MTRAPRRAHRLLALALMLGLLAAVSPTWNSVAWAKPYTQESGPGSTSGDPTGDDQPDPTPKSKLSASFSVRGQNAVRNEQHAMVRVIGSWQLFVRYLGMFPLR